MAGLRLLLVEDNEADIDLLTEKLEESRLAVLVHVARDGVEALAFLRREGAHAAAPRPDLVLLDLNMPRKGGHEVLAEVKADESLKTIPVVVLTSSSAHDDIVKSYSLSADWYLTKPRDLKGYASIVAWIEHFWATHLTPGPAGAAPEL